MGLGLFIQGPMTELEARELVSRYRFNGRKASITPSFQPGLKLVQVYLPALKHKPRSSKSYQQKIWK